MGGAGELVAPSLLGGLAAYRYSHADFGPAVASAAQAKDGLMNGCIKVCRGLDHVGDGIDITGCHAAAVSAYDAPDEGGVLIVLNDDPSPFRCQGTVDTERAVTRRASHWSHLAAQSLHSPRESGMQ